MEDKIYELHDKLDESFWYIKVRNDLLDKSIKKIKSKNNSVIADIGCGTGRHYTTLSKYGKVLCVDNSSEAIEACEKRGIKDLILADALDTGIESNSIDIACSLDVIEHIEDDLGFLKEIYRILKCGGKLIITTPAFNFLWSVDDEQAHHKRRYTKKSLKNLIKKTDFKIKKISYRYFFVFVPTLFVFLLQKIKKNKVNSLTMSPKLLNNFLIKIGAFENSLITSRLNMPIGISIFAVLEKPKN